MSGTMLHVRDGVAEDDSFGEEMERMHLENLANATEVVLE